MEWGRSRWGPRVLAQFGRALGSGPRGRAFKSPVPDVKRIWNWLRWDIWWNIRWWTMHRIHQLLQGKWHHWWVIYITDGTVRVHCSYCQQDREPTEQEKAQHPNAEYTAEQQAAIDAEVQAALDWLDEHWNEID